MIDKFDQWWDEEHGSEEDMAIDDELDIAYRDDEDEY